MVEIFRIQPYSGISIQYFLVIEAQSEEYKKYTLWIYCMATFYRMLTNPFPQNKHFVTASKSSSTTQL
jgi:hypothetical protein